MAWACTLSFVLLGITALYWHTQERQAKENRLQAFLREVEHTTYNLKHRMATYELVLRGLKGYFDGSESISKEEFQAYIASLQLADTRPDLQGVSLIRWITPGQEALSVHAPLPEPYTPVVWPPGARAHYAVVAYIEPLTVENQKVLGFDVATRAASWEALERARDDGQPAMTGKIALVQDVGRNHPWATTVTPALIMYLPLYALKARLDSVPERRAALKGWVSIQLRMENVMQGLANELDADMGLNIYDGNTVNPNALLYHTIAPGLASAGPAQTPPLQATRHLVLGGRTWTLFLQPRPGFMARHSSSQHRWIAALGALGSLTLGWVVWLLMTRRERAVLLARDMTQALRNTRDDLESTLNAVPDLLLELDLEGRIHHVRSARSDLLLAQPAQLLGERITDILPTEATAVCMAALQEALLNGYSGGKEYELVLAGQRKWFELSVARKDNMAGIGPRFIALSRDITERKQAQAHTQQLAYYDTLSGLPNRWLMLDRAQNALTLHQRLGQVGALLFLDLDNFKQINDARGHSVGDALLIQVAQRLTKLLPDSDVARVGGDEFVVLLHNLGSEMDTATTAAQDMAEKMRNALEAPYRLNEDIYSSSVSIGITLFPKNSEGVDDLLREADTAMYSAKKRGRNQLCFFEPGMLADVQESLALEQDLKVAMERGEISVHVQSQVDANAAVVGGELLLRWNHPVRGNVPPDRFIPLAEKSGLILRLGDWVILQACEALARLQATHPGLSLSVNVSPSQFRQEDFVERIGTLLAQTGAPATQLILEVTETLLVDNWEDTIARMTTLVQMGIRFSIDDFGTGYSSLAYLKKLPLFELKIDKSFVQDIPQDANDTAIVQAILSVARHLNLRVVAEGVETSVQAEFLLAQQCKELQGYLFARPCPLQPWLEQQLEK
ncbi:MAG: EAL domain-containing protein [Simplicispira sp.]|nr:EAL domain-containing protein [Simplicispira sp.]